MRPAYRYALAAVVTTGLAGALALWLATRPPPPRVEVRARPTAPAAPIAPAAAAPAGDREAVLEQLQQKEAEELGDAEAARRRRLRERMLDARAHGHEGE